MAIQYPTPPTGAREALNRSLQRFRTSDPSLDALTPLSALGGSADFGEAHQVYVLGIDDLAERRGFDASRPGSWRYFAARPSGAITAEVTDDGQGGFAFAGLVEGQLTEQEESLITSLRNNPELEDRSYQLRLLRVPGLPLQAIWLKAELDQEDRFVLARGAGEGLEAGILYDSATLLPRLQSLAAKRIGFDDAPSPV